MNDDTEIADDSDSIADDLRNAVTQLTQETPNTAPAESSSSSAEPESNAERARDASGRFVKVEPQAEAASAPDKPVTDADQPREQPQVQSNVLSPPTSWSADAKASWSSLPPALQQAVAKREAEMADGQRQWSEQRTQLEQTLAPLHQLSQQNGIDWRDGLNRLLNVEQSLRNPQTAAGMIGQLAQAYGVDLAALVNGNPQPQRQMQVPQFNPNIIPQIVDQRVSAALEEREVNSQISSFGNERDASGNLKHPHFEAVKPLMGFMLTNNQATDMEDAYQKAIWMDPSMRPQVQQPIAQPQAQQVQKARKAAVSVNGAPNGSVPKAKGFDANQSLMDDLREAAGLVSRH